MTNHSDIARIKTNLWRKAKPGEPTYYYDDAVDAMLLFVKKPDKRYVAAQADNHISLLFESFSDELIGIRIDNYYKDFTKRFAAVPLSWQLSEDANAFVDESCDLLFIFTRKGNRVQTHGELLIGYSVGVVEAPAKIEFEPVPV